MRAVQKLETVIFGGTKEEAIALYKKAEKYRLEKDYKNAKTYWLKSAKYGNPYAMYKIGLCHYHGLAGEKNNKKAYLAWTKAVEAGHKESKFCIAVCCLNGFGTEKDEVRAVKILEELKEQNHAKATYKLGECYKHSIGGLEKNPEKADLYSVLACKMGYDPAEDIIEKI
ncbi:MAG: tetratricopeptide repeat protein [Methanocorpusculum sp.]|nr:tetratricopeptide repeat protein [Methanocorpusculum sp.]